MTPAARDFAIQRTPASFQALVQAEPVSAGKYLARVADAGGLTPPWKAELEQLLTTAFEPAARATAIQTFFTKNQAALEAMAMASVQAARADTLGFTTSEPEPVLLTGTLAVENGFPVLQTTSGNLRLETPNWTGKGSNQALYFETNVLQSFAGRAVSVRAYPAEEPGVLAVEAFAPGSGSNFISGRLTNENGRIGINVRPGKWVEIRDPAAAAAIGPLAKERKPTDEWAGTGVILPNVTAKKDAQGWYLEGGVTDYWMLGRSNGVGQMEAGHGQKYSVAGTVPWPENPNQRMLVYGHSNADRSVNVSGFVMTPNVRFESGVTPRRDGASLMALAPVEVDVPDAAIDRFGV